MTILIQHLGEELTRPYGLPSVDNTPAENIEIIVRAAGSGRGAARFLGIGESTLRGWRKGARPKRSPEWLVQQARAAAQNDMYRAGRSGEGSLAVTGWIQASSDLRRRTIHPGAAGFPLALIRRALTAWDKGLDSHADALIVGGIDRYYQPLEFVSVERAWFE